MTIKRTARRCVGRFFVFDAFVVCCVWIGTITETTKFHQSAVADVATALQVLRVSRLFRLAKLFRIVHFAGILEEMMDRFASEMVRKLIAIFSIFLFVLWLTHVICCLWCAMASLPSDTGKHWTQEDHLEAEGGLTSYMYTTAFHWTFAQLTLNSIEVGAASSLERLFNLFLSLLGLVFSSLLVLPRSSRFSCSFGKTGSSPDFPMNSRWIDASSERSCWLTRRCLRSFCCLPRCRRNCMSRGPSRVSLVDPAERPHGERQVCTNAVAFKVLRSMDDLSGSSSAHAYHLVRGVLMYHQDQETSVVHEQLTCRGDLGSARLLCGLRGSMWARLPRWLHAS